MPRPYVDRAPGPVGSGTRSRIGQDDRERPEELVRVLHRGQCYTGPSGRNRVTRPADGAGDVSGCRGPLVLEQLARGHPEGATQTLDRVGPDEAEPSAQPGQAVDGVEAEAGELGQAVGGHAARLQ